MAVLSPTPPAPRRVSPAWIFPTALLCGAYGLLGLTFLSQGHGDVMSRCVLMDANLSRVTLEAGDSAKESLGYGFWMMLRAADTIHLLTGATGATLVITLDADPGGRVGAAA